MIVPGLSPTIVAASEPEIPMRVAGSSHAQSNQFLTIPRPGVVTEGDHLVAFIFNNSTQSLQMPTGWSVRGQASSPASRVDMVRKIATSSEPANYQFTRQGASMSIGQLSVFRGGLGLVNSFSANSNASDWISATGSFTKTYAGRLFFFAAILAGGRTPATPPVGMSSAGTETALYTARNYQQGPVSWPDFQEGKFLVWSQSSSPAPTAAVLAQIT